jgi:hypothetical protein
MVSIFIQISDSNGGTGGNDYTHPSTSSAAMAKQADNIPDKNDTEDDGDIIVIPRRPAFAAGKKRKRSGLFILYPEFMVSIFIQISDSNGATGGNDYTPPSTSGAPKVKHAYNIFDKNPIDDDGDIAVPCRPKQLRKALVSIENSPSSVGNAKKPSHPPPHHAASPDFPEPEDSDVEPEDEQYDPSSEASGLEQSDFSPSPTPKRKKTKPKAQRRKRTAKKSPKQLLSSKTSTSLYTHRPRIYQPRSKGAFPPSIEDVHSVNAKPIKFGKVDCDCHGKLEVNNELPLAVQINSRCKVLAALNMAFHVGEQYILCHQHKCLVPAAHIKGHFVSHGFGEKNASIRAAIKHVISSFCLSPDQQAKRILSLDIPIPFEGAQGSGLVTAVHCPVPGCDEVSGVEEVVRAHYRAEKKSGEAQHQQPIADLIKSLPDHQFPRCSAQLLFHKPRWHTAINSSPPNPLPEVEPQIHPRNASTSSDQPHLPTPSPWWAVRIGWDSYIEKVRSRGLTNEDIIALIAPPNTSISEPTSITSPAIEYGLRPVGKFVFDYLRDANKYCGESLRTAIVKG